MKLSKADYCKKFDISERWCEKLAAAGKIKVVYEKGKAFIYDESEIAKVKLNPNALKNLVGNIKTEFNRKIMEAAVLNKAEDTKRREIVKEIKDEAKDWLKRGVKITGYSETKIYDKIRKCIEGLKYKIPNPLQKKARPGKGEFKNPILAKFTVKDDGTHDYYIQNTILGLASIFYFEDANGSIRMLTQRIHMLAQNSEEYWEIAAIPFNTLYDFITAKFKQLALNQKHLLKNNFNEWRQKRIYVEGAFTNEENFGFMEAYQIDDHNQEISGVLEWDEIKQKMVPKKATLWMVSDVRTSKCLGYMQKPEAFKANDIKVLLLQVFQTYGRPSKGILMDNGLASKSAVTDFLINLDIPYLTGPAYEPLHKAIKEREFGYIKTEFNSNFKNYIGGGRHEVRHSTKKLSPESPEFMFSEYQEAFDNYMEGFYETKPRERTLNYKKRTISIRQDWEDCSKGHTWFMVPRQELNYAYKEYKIKKLGDYWLHMGNDMGVYDAGSVNFLHPTYIGKEYAVFYNPLDTNHVDLYATEFFQIPEQGGAYYDVGDFVMTLDSQRKKGSAKRQEDAKRLHALLQKQTRQLGNTISNAVNFEGVNAAMPELNVKGEYSDPRKKQEKEAVELVKETVTSVKKILEKRNADKLDKKQISLNKPTETNTEGTELSPEDLIEKWS